MFDSIIATKDVTLRPMQESDINAWQKWDADPEVQKYMPDPPNDDFSEEAGLGFFNECKNEENDYYWTIVDNALDVPIGTISLIEINRYHGTAEIGVVIGDKRYWGKGFATRAIIAVIGELERLGIRRVLAEYEEGNVGMEKTLIKAGFIFECKSKSSRIKNGKPIDTYRYVFLRN